MAFIDKSLTRFRSRLAKWQLVPAIFFFYVFCSGQVFPEYPDYIDALELKRQYKYEEAIAKTALAILTSEHKKDTVMSVRLKLEKAAIFRLMGQYDSAIHILTETFKSGKIIIHNNNVLKALAIYELGANYIHKGDLEKGKSSIINSIAIYKNIYGQEDTLLAQCYSKLGNYYLYKKQYDSSLYYYELSYSLYLKKTEKKIELPSYLINLGIGYFASGEYEKAEHQFQKAIGLISEYQPDNYFILCKAYSNLGLFYYNLSSYEKSLHSFNEAEKVGNQYSDNYHLDLGNLAWNKAILYLGLGDLNKAVQYIHQARQIFEMKFAKNNAIFSALNMDQALIYESIGLTDEAVKLYRQSLNNSAIQVKLKTYRNLAKLYMNKQDLQASEKYFDTCFSIIDTSRDINPVEVAYTELYYGNFLIKSKDKSAIKHLNIAFELFINTFGIKHRDVAKVLQLTGDFYLNQDKLDLALYYYHQGIISINPAFNNAELLSNPQKSELSVDQHTISMFEKKALALMMVYKRTNNPDYLLSLLNLYDLMVYTVEQFTKLYRTEDGRMLLWEEFHDIYKMAVEANFLAYEELHESEYLEKAFELSEKSKSSILLAELRDENAKNLGLIPEDIYQMEKILRGNLYMYKTNIFKEEDKENPSPGKLDYMRSNLFHDEKKYDSLLNIYEEEYPEYYKLKYDPSVIKVTELQDLLGKDEVLLEFTITKGFLITFLISKNEFNAYKSPLDSLLVPKIFALRNNLKIPQAAHYKYKDFKDFQEISHYLYNTLIRPVENKIDGTYITIVPDGELAYLSFESLTESILETDTINFRDLPYLIAKYTFSYESSATIYSMGEQAGYPRLHKGVLSMAPSYPLVKRSVIKEYGDFGGASLANRNLPGANWEAETILNYIHGDKLSGEDATEANFKQKAADYDILHFAMHTSIDDENPLSSKLSFYPLGELPEDDVLHTYEIYNMKLKGHLAVLSACSSGSGKLQKGEGVISLARAFAFAGMPSVVMTLWDVEDITSGFIIPDFYYILSKGIRKDQSLRLSKLNYIRTAGREIEAHPAFWSGFVVYGNKMPFRQPLLNIYTIALVILGSLIVIISAILIKRYITYRKNKFNHIQYFDLPREF